MQEPCQENNRLLSNSYNDEGGFSAGVSGAFRAELAGHFLPLARARPSGPNLNQFLTTVA
jgi:hypothetical protein